MVGARVIGAARFVLKFVEADFDMQTMEIVLRVHVLPFLNGELRFGVTGFFKFIVKHLKPETVVTMLHSATLERLTGREGLT